MDILPPFPGFRPEAFQFLRDLAANNEREWFKPRKQTFEDEVQWPLRCLVVDVGRRASSEGLPLTADPKKAVFRIYRDTRFSNNKAPYKTALGATISRNGTHKDQGFVYVHVEPGKCFAGGGFWHPDGKFLKAWREHMVARPEAFLEITHRLAESGLEINEHDDMLKRIPRGFENVDDPELAPYLKHKSFTVSRAYPDAALQRTDFAEEVLSLTRSLMPLLEFGWSVEKTGAQTRR